MSFSCSYEQESCGTSRLTSFYSRQNFSAQGPTLLDVYSRSPQGRYEDKGVKSKGVHLDLL